MEDLSYTVKDSCNSVYINFDVKKNVYSANTSDFYEVNIYDEFNSIIVTKRIGSENFSTQTSGYYRYKTLASIQFYTGNKTNLKVKISRIDYNECVAAFGGTLDSPIMEAKTYIIRTEAQRNLRINACYKDKPDLTINEDDVYVSSTDCIKCKPLLSELGNNNTPERYLLEYSTSELSIQLYVKNIGKGRSPLTKVTFYVSKDKELTTVGNAKDKMLKEVDIPKLNPIKKYKTSPGISIDQGDFGYDFKSGYYYIIAKVNSKEEIDETLYSNNTVFIPISYQAGPSSKFDDPKNHLKFEPDNDVLIYAQKSTTNKKYSSVKPQILQKPYQLVIYTFSKIKVIDVIVSSKDDEYLIIKDLPKGLYIVKSGDSTSKIYKE